MSVQTVNQFLQAVSEAPQLQEDLNKALEGENSPQALIDFAAKHGYRFTAEELLAEAQHLQNEFQQRQDIEELNEEELKSVVGGNLPLAVGMTAVGAASAAIKIADMISKSQAQAMQNIKGQVKKRGT
jgi:predicted ribosomally synthesized peptide with nif11-like leader